MHTVAEIISTLHCFTNWPQQCDKFEGLISGFPRLLESPGKSWIFFLENSRNWKVLEKRLRSWNVLEKFPWKLRIFYRF